MEVYSQIRKAFLSSHEWKCSLQKNTPNSDRSMVKILLGMLSDLTVEVDDICLRLEDNQQSRPGKRFAVGLTCQNLAFGQDAQHVGQMVSEIAQRWETSFALSNVRLFLDDITSSTQMWMPKGGEGRVPSSIYDVILKRREAHPMHSEITLFPTDVCEINCNSYAVGFLFSSSLNYQYVFLQS